MENFEVKLSQREYEGKMVTDLFLCFKGHEFLMVPCTRSKKARSYFYALLTNPEKH